MPIFLFYLDDQWPQDLTHQLRLRSQWPSDLSHQLRLRRGFDIPSGSKWSEEILSPGFVTFDQYKKFSQLFTNVELM